MRYAINMTDPLLFQVCQKIVVFNKDFAQVLLARRKGEQDYDGVFSFIGGKLETTDGGIEAGLKREKDEEIGLDARLRVCPTVSYNVYFTKKDGHHMVLPHYIAQFTGGRIVINNEYSEFSWVGVDDLETFEPKIASIVPVTEWAKHTAYALASDEWVAI